MNQRPRKILSVYNRYLNRGGEDEVFEDEARLLKKHGCQVDLVTEQVSAPAGAADALRMASNAVWSAGWKARFGRLLQDLRPDVVHVHNAFPNFSPSIYYACHEAGVPVVQTLHNFRLLCPAATLFRDGRICEDCIDHSLLRSLRHGCYRGSRPATATLAATLTVHRALGTWRDRVDTYIALSEFARGKFIAAGLPAHKIVVKPNFVDPDPGCRTAPGHAAIFVGRFWPEKGVRTMLEAWGKLGGLVPLDILGDGPERPDMEAAAAHLAGVRFHGRVPREHTLAAIKQARFLVFPSEWYEGLPMTLIEAFAAGVPVITSRLGTMQEIVDDGRTGLHFTAGDPADLAAKVRWAMDHAHDMEAMGRAARAEYEARYTADRNYDMLMAIYESAIAARARTTHAAAGGAEMLFQPRGSDSQPAPERSLT